MNPFLLIKGIILITTYLRWQPWNVADALDFGCMASHNVTIHRGPNERPPGHRLIPIQPPRNLVQMARHHIIPYWLLRDFHNFISEHEALYSRLLTQVSDYQPISCIVYTLRNTGHRNIFFVLGNPSFGHKRRSQRRRGVHINAYNWN